MAPCRPSEVETGLIETSLNESQGTFMASNRAAHPPLIMRVEGGLFSSHIRILETGTTAMRPDGGGGAGESGLNGDFLKG